MNSKQFHVILVTVLLAASAMGSIKDRCLHVCSCTGPEDKVDVKCQGLPEGWWPKLFPFDTINLDLSGNPLKHVTESSLQKEGLESLAHLNLSNCRLNTIDSKAFKFVPQLKELDLSFNNLSELKVEDFKDLESLQRIRLMGYDRLQCKKLRKALHPLSVTVLCGGHVTTSSSEASMPVESSSEPTVTSTSTLATSAPETTLTAKPTPTPEPETTSTPATSTPRDIETPVTPTDTVTAERGGVGSGAVAAIGVACFVVGALVVFLGFVAWHGLHCYERLHADNDER